MRIGFVLECSPQGPDANIYPYLAKIFCPELEIDGPKTLLNKDNVMLEGPAIAKTLLSAGCDYVFIIWDKMPRWGGKGSCKDHIIVLEKGLAQEGVDRAKIFLCCIDEMLESWMIADGRALTKWITSKTNYPLPNFADHKTSADQKAPKERIRNYLKNHFPKWRYKDFEDNFNIVKQLTNFDRVANWNSSFKFFKDSVEEICP